MTDKQTLINMLIVRIEDAPMPRLYDWEEKRVVIEALKLLADSMKGGDSKMTRKQILEEAEKCVCGQRQEDYGEPEDNFRVIADLWGTYTGLLLKAHDVAMMMALLKIGRIQSGRRTEDSYIDLAGYAACAGELAEGVHN